MDPSSTRRFLSTNVEWPAEKLFIPRGGLTNFLCDNLRFKVFLVMTAVFTDAYAFDTVKSLTTGERLAIRFRVRDIVRHMIRQNEFRVHYESGVVPSEAAWLFHVILVLLVVVGFEGEEAALVPAPSANVSTEGALAQSQATFFLGAALATFVSHKEDGFDDAQLDFPAYDSACWVSGNIHYRARPSYSEDNLTSPFLDTRVRWSVTLANKFDMFVGRPNYGFSPETRKVFVARIALAGELAHANQDANSILDVPLSAEYLSLPVVPLWNRDRIEELLKREQADPFIGEECFLQDQIMASQGLAHAIQKASDLETEGFSGHPSGRYRV
ncbi:hypothetical protein DFH06DRAFT_1435715 [Mycena polygramma]|nr:hypothetical protein DFH06DRAFT_1435715 [Mycena polygramma]